LALAVPLSRFTPRVGGGSAFYVRQHEPHKKYTNLDCAVSIKRKTEHITKYHAMKKLIPYILAYLIVATGTAVYPHIYRHFVRQAPTVFPADSVALVSHPGLSQAELDAKLQQVGLSEAVPHAITVVRPTPFYSLAYHYVFDAVIFAAFAGLVILFQRRFRSTLSDHVDAA
jgi:hypothetical protein